MTPRTKEQNEEIRKRRIYQIRHTAAEVYLEKGMRMEMGDVAKKAGLGRGTIYHYYNNKLTLLEELLDDAYTEACSITQTAFPPAEDPLICLERYAKRLLTAWLEKPFIFVLYQHFFQPVEPLPLRNREQLLHNVHHHLYSPVVRTIETGIRTGRLASADAERSARIFFGSLVGTASCYLLKNSMLEAPSDSRWMDDLVCLLHKGLRTKSEEKGVACGDYFEK
ncbi:TetR/AcrR family transcriptional regulator [Brevibacillus humidisoli]|uniref:TetR/AcrR family transcriptional regulator n=1 Tax=Brevibacillus humidisoli TaxID=2895522 RepID=UPI001E5EFD74|nr:TetR/AcrR family transcriptional regulator [Brevibacillus humidisoli]UFJ41252.1 TetR/AcrR family transcriptional regulator [Brevibacillus humidisoli]